MRQRLPPYTLEAADTFVQVVARLPELVGLTADLVEPKGGGSDADSKPARVVVVGEGLEKSLAKGEKVTRVCLDTVLEQALLQYT